jgi:hypothetical protein
MHGSRHNSPPLDSNRLRVRSLQAVCSSSSRRCSGSSNPAGAPSTAKHASANQCCSHGRTLHRPLHVKRLLHLQGSSYVTVKDEAIQAATTADEAPDQTSAVVAFLAGWQHAPVQRAAMVSVAAMVAEAARVSEARIARGCAGRVS